MSRKDWTENYKDYYKENSESIIDTKDLINRAIMLTGNDGLVQANLCKELINVKATRALKIGLDENTSKLVSALNKNSNSSDFLAKVGIFIGMVGAIATCVGAYYGYLTYIN